MNKTVALLLAILLMILDGHRPETFVFEGLVDVRDIVEGNYREVRHRVLGGWPIHAPALDHSVKNSAPKGSSISRNVSSMIPKH